MTEMFERPTKADIDHALSMLMHDARRQLSVERSKIVSQAAGAGFLQSDRVIVFVGDAADKIHASCLRQAVPILRDFIERMERPSKEITEWARPHLENLSNVILGAISANGSPAEYQRMIVGYPATFQQRVDGALRDLEIGYVKGAGFSARMEMSNRDEWMSAADALAFVNKGMSPGQASRAICKRAHAGLVKAKAARFILQDKSSDDTEVPREMWWAEGEAALTQNWTTGDFETWRDQKIHLKAFGVMFRRADVQKMIPPPSIQKESSIIRPMGDKIFIGHGRSKEWLVLQEFLRYRLGLPVEEFNSSPTAGIMTAARLKEILNNAAFAFLVMTAEDERPDGGYNPRLNVVHEAGLFQGRLGFERAIILLEDGCEPFSNIDGLGQIRFPKDDISAKFEEVRRTLEREGLIAAPR